ncbi:MAG: hypothetical protein C4539_01100 [Ignavibacteriales bacterium]|nr:MAG: hypothetical protein C4539_01100 [Ignavibacteriales bacterium]
MLKKIFLFISLLFLGTEVNAQNSMPDKNETPIDTAKYLEDITIVATRYAESILEIPYAVTLINPKQLENVKGYGLDEILSSVPGVLAQSRAGNQDVRLVIRGFGARGAGDRSNSGTSRGLRIMLDGFPETEPDGRTSFDNIDLSLADNIEVVRSNASALWGNASGGIININTVPYFQNTLLDLQFASGSFGFNKGTFQAGAKVGEGQVYSSVSYTSFDGWRNHSAGKRAIANLYFISNLSRNTRLGAYLTGTSNIFHIPGPLTLNQFEADPEQANSIYEKRDERRYNRLGRIGITFEHGLNTDNQFSVMAFVNPKYLQRSERGTYRDFTRYHVGGSFIYHNNYEFNKQSSNKFSVGMDEAYQDGAILFYSLSSSNERGTLSTNKREGANTFGVFFQDEIIIDDKISIIAGGRFDNVTYYSEDFLEPQFGLQDKKFSKFTPKAGFTYRFSQTQSLYANLGGGIEVPAGNETDPAGTYGQDSVYLLNPLLEPIVSTTYEVGTKHIILFGEESLFRQLNYDLAFYYIDIKNDIIPYRGGRFYFTAGKTTRVGAELGLNLFLAHGINLQTSFTYSQNKYKDYLVDSAHYGSVGKSADYNENKVAGIPDLFYNAKLGFTPTFIDGISFSFSLNGIGKYFADDANKIEVPAYTVSNISIGTSKNIFITKGVSFKGFISVNNLFDKKYAASAFINPDVVKGEAVYLEPGMPRNITFSVSINFN